MSRSSRGASAAPYDRISAAYDLIADPAEHRARDRGLELLSAQTGERVLEIGAGTGRALVRLAEAVGPSGRVLGVDLSAGMLRLASERLAPLRAYVHLQRGDGRSLPYRAARFDAAFMSFTLELFEAREIEIVLSEVARVLRPRGRLVVVCMAATPEPGPVAQAYVWLHRHFPHFIDCQPIDVVSHLARSGFRPIRQESMTLFALPVAIVSAARA